MADYSETPPQKTGILTFVTTPLSCLCCYNGCIFNYQIALFPIKLKKILFVRLNLNKYCIRWERHELYISIFYLINSCLCIYFYSAEQALHLPVLTFASGPTNSMRGAAFLSGVQDAVVIDIGGTTTDVGVLKGGFPRQASARVKVE